MAEDGKIEIRVTGKIGNEPLSPDNFDIREIRELFDVVETLLYPSNKLGRPSISYSIKEGSVKNIFTTTRQAAVSFLAIIAMVQETNSLEGLELSTAKALQEVQKSAVRNNYIYEFYDPGKGKPSLTISSNTSFHINENLWADAEFYFYGTLVNAGGKDKSNVHINTKEHGLLIIATEKQLLMELKENVLYKFFKVQAKGRQNIITKELDASSLKLLEMEPFDPAYTEQYITDLIKKASPKWKNVRDVDNWLSKIRGIND